MVNGLHLYGAVFSKALHNTSQSPPTRCQTTVPELTSWPAPPAERLSRHTSSVIGSKQKLVSPEDSTPGVSLFSPTGILFLSIPFLNSHDTLHHQRHPPLFSCNFSPSFPPLLLLELLSSPSSCVCLPSTPLVRSLEFPLCHAHLRLSSSSPHP